MMLPAQVATQIGDSSPLLKKQKEPQNVQERYVVHVIHNIIIIMIMLQ